MPDASNPKIRVLAVDDHGLLLEGIVGVIGATADICVVAQAADGLAAVAAYKEHRPDVALMDIQLPALGGIEALQRIRAFDPDARVIMLTTYEGDAQALRAIRAGASGYLLKSALRTGLPDVIRTVHAGKRHIPSDVAAELLNNVENRLTDREIGVLQLVAEGNSNKKVGQKLGVTEDAIKAHMKNITAKLSAQDRTHAVTIAIRKGIIEIPPPR